MERVMSVEEKIRRAEEIYERKQQGGNKNVAKVSVNNNKKDIKLLKKMIIQIVVCVAIYLVIYNINNSQYVFSEDFSNKVNEILSFDTNFVELYSEIQKNIGQLVYKQETNTTNDTEERNESKNEETTESGNNETEGISESKEKMSQEDKDISDIKSITSFIKPIEGVVSSKFGSRETATGNVPKNHTGTDIAANLGTKIKSATDGEVVLASNEGDYRKTFKNSNRRSKYNICAL